ncbi:MAG: hypothetical protein QM723_24275 [Myxococcaceae bacterium]
MRKPKSHPVTRVACVLGAVSLVTFVQGASFVEHRVAVYSLFPALAAIALGFAGFVLSHAQPRRFETSATRLALASASLTIVLTLSCSAVSQNLPSLSRFIDDSPEQVKPLEHAERPAWMSQPKNPYRVSVPAISSLY